MAKSHFFIGKGGVGKTTVSAAFAVRHALRHPNQSVLLLSTDPAHSISDVLHQRLGDRPKRVPLPGRAKLYAWQVNAEKQFGYFLRANREAMISILESGTIFSRRDIEPFLETTLPGMAEMSALLAVHEATQDRKYDRIVVDTAPLGHTLRLFELPDQFARFLDFLEVAASRDQVLASHFGGDSKSFGGRLIGDWRKLVEAVQTSFVSDAELVLVTTAEKFSLNESIRGAAILRDHSPSLQISSIVLNRAVLRSADCPICRQKARSTRQARQLLKREFPDCDLYIGEDPGSPVVGPAGLRVFGEHVFSGRRLILKTQPPPSKTLRLVRTEWPVLENPLSLVLGKGGVGKTTVSAALAFRTRSKSPAPVEICSVDPAPSLDDIFQTEVGDEPKPVLGDSKLRASELDSVASFKNWASGIKDVIDNATSANRAGIHVDFWFERQLFAQLLDSVPPGVDELLGVLRILDLLGSKSKRVIIDMAPTGHALELLHTPERIAAWTRLLLKTLAAHRTLALARDAGVIVAQLGHRVRELLRLLKDSKYTRIHTVMLAEYLPDRETQRLMDNLDQLALGWRTLFVNRVLFPEDIGQCRRCKQARSWQLATLARLRRWNRSGDLFIIRNFPNEIAGKNALRSFTGELWRVR